MISSTTSTDRTARPELLTPSGQPAKRPQVARPDNVTTEQAQFLQAELARQPEIRPQVVERARALAADPNYPPTEVLRNIAGQILNSPDLSEDQT